MPSRSRKLSGSAWRVAADGEGKRRCRADAVPARAAAALALFDPRRRSDEGEWVRRGRSYHHWPHRRRYLIPPRHDDVEPPRGPRVSKKADPAGGSRTCRAPMVVPASGAAVRNITKSSCSSSPPSFRLHDIIDCYWGGSHGLNAKPRSPGRASRRKRYSRPRGADDEGIFTCSPTPSPHRPQCEPVPSY